MTGFTLGGTAGATLGTKSGGTLGTGPDAWLVDGQRVPTQQDETATFNSLTVEWRVSTTVLTDHLRPLKPNEGKVDALTTDGGGFTAVDRADGANTVTLTPPRVRHPLRQEGEYHVARYEEDMVSQSVDEWAVTVEFVPAANRTDVPTISTAQQVPQPTTDSGGTLGQSSGFTLGESGGATLGTPNADTVPADYWTLGTRYADLATDRIDAEFVGTGADGVERFEVVARLTFEQAHVWEAALSLQHGQRVRELPDAPNRAVDETGGANTVTITSPVGSVVSDGDYVVLDWESTRLNDGYQEIECEVAREG